jgi:hypothetical protein
VQPCHPTVNGGYDASRTNYAALGKLDAFRAFNILVETADWKKPMESTLGSDDDVFDVSGQGDGHVPRNLRLALQLIDVVQPYLVETSMQVVVTAHSADRRAAVTPVARSLVALQQQQQQLQQQEDDDNGGVGWFQRVQGWTTATLRRLRGRAVVPTGSLDAFLSQYEQWIQTSVCASTARISVHSEWDIGGGYVVNKTRLRVGVWPSDVAPATLLQPADVNDPDGTCADILAARPCERRARAAFTDSFSLPADRAFTVVRVWKLFLAGEDDSDAQGTIGALPEGWATDSAVQAGTTRWLDFPLANFGREPFKSRFSTSVDVFLPLSGPVNGRTTRFLFKHCAPCTTRGNPFWCY